MSTPECSPRTDMVTVHDEHVGPPSTTGDMLMRYPKRGHESEHHIPPCPRAYRSGALRAPASLPGPSEGVYSASPVGMAQRGTGVSTIRSFAGLPAVPWSSARTVPARVRLGPWTPGPPRRAWPQPGHRAGDDDERRGTRGLRGRPPVHFGAGAARLRVPATTATTSTRDPGGRKIAFPAQGPRNTLE